MISSKVARIVLPKRLKQTFTLDQISDSRKNFCKNSVSLHGFSFYSSYEWNKI